MVDLKHNIKADRIGYLYRAALYLAQGDIDTSLLFLDKSSDILPIAHELFQSLLKDKEHTSFNDFQKRVFAEKILDEYKKQTFLLRLLK